MSHANGFSPKRAHKYKVNASILKSGKQQTECNYETFVAGPE